MGELLFILKSLVLTIVVVILLQIKMGQTTLEEKTVHWLQTSSYSLPLQQVADGGVKAIRQFWNNTFGSIKGSFFKTFKGQETPGNRSLGFDLERSQEYLREQAEKAQQKAEEMYETSKEEILEATEGQQE